MFFLEKFIWKHRMQLWKPRRSLLDGKLKKFSSKSEGDKKTTIFSKFFFLKMALCIIECSVDSATSFFWQKVENYFLIVQNCLKKWKFLLEKYFASKCSSRVREIGWRSGNLAEFFLIKSWICFCSMYKYVSKTELFSKRDFFCFKLFLWKSRIQLRQFQPIFFGRIQKKSSLNIRNW